LKLKKQITNQISSDNHYINNESLFDEENGKDKTEKQNKAAKRKLKKQKQKENRKNKNNVEKQDDDKLKEALKKEAENAKKADAVKNGQQKKRTYPYNNMYKATDSRRNGNLSDETQT